MKPSPAGKGDRLRWMRRSPNNRQTVSKTTILIKSFLPLVAKSSTICQRHISYCEAVYHSSLLISFPRKRPSHLAAFSLRQKAKEKAPKRKADTWGAAPHTPAKLFEKSLDSKTLPQKELFNKILFATPVAKSSTILNS